MNQNLNTYGDKGIFVAHGHGADIASQRADELDLMAIDHLQPECWALDLACGCGGQTARMREQGASVLAADIMDMSEHIKKVRDTIASQHPCLFVQGDMRCPACFLPQDIQYRVIVWQRAMHYLPFSAALEVLKDLKTRLTPDGRIYLSASGLKSELGDGYAHRLASIQDRYCPLTPEMADKHDIRGNVCLYSESDMINLANRADLNIVRVFTSLFGNIKCVLAK